jgi:hypothetical protein
MNMLPLPALDGRSPLGFLAALGVLRLATRADGYPQAKLSWSLRSCTAELHDAHTEVGELEAFLARVVGSIPEGGVLPDLPKEFPPPGAAPDQLRLPRRQLREFTDRLDPRGDPERTSEIERWLCSLVTDLRLDDKGRSAISLFTAPSGKQSMRTMLEKPLASVRGNPHSILEALTGWRRYPGVTGEYLDHRVLFDAADAPDGKSLERGVPGATWLALMSYPLMMTSASGLEPITSGWRPAVPGKRGRQFVYPLWSRPVGVPAIRALLEHPAVAAADVGRASRTLETLGVFRICAAERQRLSGRTFAGVLTPIREPSGGDSQVSKRRASSARREPAAPARSGASTSAAAVIL